MSQKSEPTALPASLSASLEALLISSDEPVKVADLAAFLNLPDELIEEAMTKLAQTYEHRGLNLRESVRGWAFVSAPACDPLVTNFLGQQNTSRLSKAAVETLAIVAYKQPVTRSDVSNIRGVNSDSVVRSLIVRGLVAEEKASAKSPSKPGSAGDTRAQAAGAKLASSEATSTAKQLVTTDLFLEKMGIASLDELEPLAPLLPQVSQVAQISEEESKRLAARPRQAQLLDEIGEENV
ncbi:MAG TPA: SMC-Scp complex subunit ScpB [Aeriscardovia aeriphila]|uniref:SMC-Scp complex subunit ScpB n=1 Tax=Aeriscardovia aeriphila TaxID=218139 RepID=A0A921FU28_9BIFI|nr:SMC-Scp complex subunit ScpB [Aeriscardovia aeriphila]